MKNKHTFDVICLGRAAVDLYGEQIGSRLEDVTSFSKTLGGSSCNIAFGTARLGLRSSMLTRVGDEQMGNFIIEELVRVGCDVSHVVKDPERLTGLVLLSIKDSDSFPLLFYRNDCADMAVDTADFDAGYIASSKSLLITGTHFSTKQTDKTSRKAIEFARAAGTKVILDIDYRPVLWGLTGLGEGDNRFVSNQSVTDHMLSILPLCDLIVGTEEEIHIAAHAQAMGATSESVNSIAQLEQAFNRAKASAATYVIAIDTDPYVTTDNGEAWWDVAIPEISNSNTINKALENYKNNKIKQPY